MFKVFQQKFNEVSPQVQWTLPEDMTLEQARVTMVQLLSAESVNHHRLGVVYNYVVDKKLAELAGFKDARDWVSKNLREVSQASLTMYGVVALKDPLMLRAEGQAVVLSVDAMGRQVGALLVG